MGKETIRAEDELRLDALWPLFRLSTILFVGVCWFASSRLAVLMYRHKYIDPNRLESTGLIDDLLSSIGNFGMGAVTFVGTWVLGLHILQTHQKKHPISAILG